MHKKVQSLLITGVLSANMVGSTVAVFADDIKKENGIKTEATEKPNGEDNIKWQTTDKKNLKELWICEDKVNEIVLKEYIGAKKNETGAKENNIDANKKNVEIPREIDGKRVVLENLNKKMFPNVERIKVADGITPIELRAESLFEAFANNNDLKSLDLRGIDVSKVNDLCSFVFGSSKLEEVNLSGWDVSKVTDMSSLFYKASSLKKVDISDWKPSEKLTRTDNMFFECFSLKSIDLSGFDMSNVTTANSMFQKCSSLTEIKGTKNWTLEKAEKIGLMFSGTKLNFIDLSNVNLQDKLEPNNMQGMFGYIDDNDDKRLLVVTDDKTLNTYKYEIDKRTKFNVKFNTDGGEFSDKADTKTINEFTISTEIAKLLSSPTKKGYKFEGWDTIQNDTVTAKWKLEDNSGESPETPGGEPNKPEVGPETPGGEPDKPEVGPEIPGGEPDKPEVGPETPGGEPDKPEVGPETPGGEPNKPEVGPETPGGEPDKPEVGPETPGGEPNKPEVGPETPGGEPDKPEVGPETPGGEPNKPEVGPETPGGETDNDNTPVLDGTDKDNIMIHPLECLPSVYTLVDENMVSITQRGDGTENNPVILQVKDSIYKVDLNHFITKFDTLNSNVSTITRSDKYTEYKMIVDNKNLNDPTKSKTTNVIIRINNTKLDLLKEANKYSRRRNYNVQIPTIVKFNDVKDNFWGRSYIEDFASMGVVDGYPNNEFKPNNSITRAEFVRIINNAFGYTKPIDNVKFNDVEKNSWYYNDIAIGLEQGYINGRSETVFSPNDNITREEVAMILTNIMKNKDNDFNRLNNFNDGNKTSDWAKSAMAGAIKAGYLIGDDQKNLSPTKNMTRAEAIASLSRVRPVK